MLRQRFVYSSSTAEERGAAHPRPHAALPAEHKPLGHPLLRSTHLCALVDHRYCCYVQQGRHLATAGDVSEADYHREGDLEGGAGT